MEQTSFENAGLASLNADQALRRMRVTRAPAPIFESPQVSPDLPAQKSILLVEDEQLLRWHVEDTLLASGHLVRTAATGDDAFAAMDRSGPFHLLVTDIKLKDGPDGWFLARRAREIEPGIGVLYMSGDSAGLHSSHGVPGSLMLSKPFEPPALEQRVARLLKDREA